MRLKKVDGPFASRNFFIDLDSGMHYVKRMVRGRVVWRSTGHTAVRSAHRRYLEIMKDLSDEKSGWSAKRVPTLDEWWNTYRQAKRKSPNTWRREEEIMTQHWLPQFGKLRLDEITQGQIERQLNWRRKRGAAEGTVTREHSLLQAVFNAAIDDELIERNPLRKIPRTAYATRQKVLSLEDQAKLRDVLSSMLYRWLQFMLGTGLRLEECRQLSPRDIDWDAKTIHVVGKGHNGIPKEREVPLLSDALLDILKAQIAENEGDPSRHRRNRRGTLWAQEQVFFRKELTKACKRAEVAFISPHTLRHTFATRYLQGGGNIYVLSQLLGHHSVEITEKVYAHLRAKDRAKLSEKVELGIVVERVKTEDNGIRNDRGTAAEEQRICAPLASSS